MTPHTNCEFNSDQPQYTVTERELLSIVETLKEFRAILLGQKFRIYTDNKNLTYNNLSTDRVLILRLILEEYGPDIEYIKGDINTLADSISGLTLNGN